MFRDLPVWFGDVAAGCLLAVTGIYGLAYMYFRRRKRMSDVLTNKQYRFVLIGVMIGGILLAISGALFHGQ
ncbi:MAG TPA: hypothetical protein VGO57_13810 [Verrucomicrobiae bacterium]|jgi:hypothetical protein